jgi:hypothetical protein
MTRRVPRLETLEARLAPSASPFLYSTLDDTAQAPGHTTATAQAVSLSPMMQSRVVVTRYWGTNNTDSTHDVYRVQLHQGQIFTAYDVAVPVWGIPVVNRLSLLDSSSTQLAGASLPGAVYNPGFAYRVQQDGTYYVTIDLFTVHDPSAYYAPAVTNYEVDLRPIGLNPSMQDPNWLQKTGGEMDVWLDGSTLDISGPAGHGFGLRGNWQQTVTQSGSLSYSTYTASGIITIQGAINVGLPHGQTVTITTQPSQWGGLFGPVGSLVGEGSFSLGDVAGTLGKNSPLGLQLAGTSSALPNQRWGIDLGSGINNSGVPLNAAVPYLHFTSSDDTSAMFGGLQVQADHVGHGFTMVDDPADPFLYVGVNGVPLIKKFGVGWSTRDLIPFAPGSAPANYHGALAGNFYHTGEVDLSDVDIPIVIDGDWTVNFDPNHTGKLFGGAAITASDIVGIMTGKETATPALLKQLNTAFTNVSFEHNGSLSLNLSEDDVGGIQIPIVQDTDVYDGAAQTLYMHVNSVNPFQGTFLQDYVKGDVSLDGTYSRPSGQWDILAKCDLDLFRQETVGMLELNNQGVKLDGTIHALGTNVELKGNVYSNGDASLTGDATVNLVVANVEGHFDLERHANQTTLTASATLDTLGTAVYLSGTVYADGDYTLGGWAYTNFYVGWGWGDFTLTHSGGSTELSVKADVGVLGQDAQFKGDIHSDGTYSIAAKIDSGFYLAGGEADFTLAKDSNGTTCMARANLYLLGASLDFTGQAYANGDFTLTESSGFGIPGLVGTVSESLTLSRTSGNVALTGELTATTPAIPVFVPTPIPFEFLVSVWANLDLQFSVTADANGAASYSGTCTVTGEGWFTIGGQQGLGSFSIGVANDALAFNVDGIGFAIVLPH